MISNQPLVSIGMPVYNGENFICPALESLLNQTFEDFELIISDNASTDNTEKICREYAAKDPRITYHRNEQNIGAGRNHNVGVKLAKGKYFKWACHDDLCDPKLLEKCVQLLENNPLAVLAYSQSVLIDEQDRIIEHLVSELGLESPHSHERLQRYHQWLTIKGSLKKRQIGLWTPVYGVIRMSALKQTNLIGNYLGADTILLEELLLLGEFCELPETLFLKRDHPGRFVRSHHTIDQELAWYEPTRKPQKIVFDNWRLLKIELIAITKIQISWWEKILSYKEVIRYFLVSKHKVMINEIIYNIARILGIQSIKVGNFKKELPRRWKLNLSESDREN